MDEETIDFEWLNLSLEDFGYAAEEDERIAGKLKQLCAEFNKSSDALLDDVMAALINAKKKTFTYTMLEQLEGELEKKLKKTLSTPKTPTAKPHISRMSALGKASTPTSRRLNDSPSLVASPAVDGDFEKRKDSGKIVNNLTGKLYVEGRKASRITVELVSDPVSQYYASDKPAYVIGAKSERMTEMARLLREQYPEIKSWHNPGMVTSEPVFCYGELVSDIWEGQPLGEANPATLLVDDEAGSLVKIDLSQLKDVCLFSGMVIALEGNNENGDVFVASRLLLPQPPALPKIMPENIGDSDNLHILAACGPFTSPSNCSYSHLQAFLDIAKEQQPNLLILMGPFVDRRNKVLTDKNAPVVTYESQLETVFHLIGKAFENTSTHVVLAPNAQRDATLVPEFPSVPFQQTGELTKLLGQRLHCVSDPAIISVNGVQIAMVGPDILAHLSKSIWLFGSYADSQRMERITRLAASLLSQRLLYPLSPPQVPTSLLSLYRTAQFAISPHVLLAPSMLISCIKEVPNSALTINPANLCRGASGTYLKCRISTGVLAKTENATAAECGHFEIVKI